MISFAAGRQLLESSLLAAFLREKKNQMFSQYNVELR